MIFLINCDQLLGNHIYVLIQNSQLLDIMLETLTRNLF